MLMEVTPHRAYLPEFRAGESEAEGSYAGRSYDSSMMMSSVIGIVVRVSG